MAWIFDVSNAGDATNGGAHAIYLLKELLKSAGWDVPASGTGTSGSSAASDLITSAAVMNGSRAWFRLRAPATMSPRREFCIQRGTGGQTTWWVKVSAEDGFVTGGDADDMPTATDEQNLHGSSVAGTTLFGTAGGYSVHCGADNASPFAWYLFTAINGTGAQAMALCFLPLITNSYPTSDPDPAVYYANASGAPFTISTFATSSSGPFGWHAKNSGGEAWARYVPCIFCDSGGTRQVPNTGVNPNSSRDDVVPIILARGSGLSTQVGWKGQPDGIRWAGNTARGEMQTIDDLVLGDAAWIVRGNVALRWDGSVPVF